MNDPKLQLAMAKLLPERIKLIGVLDEPYLITSDNGNGCITTRKILETEWLYVMHLVEQTLTRLECANYSDALLRSSVEVPSKADEFFWHFNFNQRATSMCKVKELNYERYT